MGNFNVQAKLLPNKKLFVYLHLQIGDGVVAQLVERRTENPCVTGSIPVDATKKRIKDPEIVRFQGLLFLVK